MACGFGAGGRTLEGGTSFAAFFLFAIRSLSYFFGLGVSALGGGAAGVLGPGGGAACILGGGGRSVVGGPFSIRASMASILFLSAIRSFVFFSAIDHPAYFFAGDGGCGGDLGGATCDCGALGRLVVGGGFRFFFSVPSLI